MKHSSTQHQEGTSRRGLRVGALLCRASGAITALVAVSTAAVAEVCDKVVGEHWHPSDGVVKTVFDWDWSGISPVVPLVVFGIPAAFLGVPLLLRALRARERGAFITGVYLKWVAYGAAAFMTLVALFLIRALFFDAVLQSAASEGCITWTTNWTAVAMITLVVLLYGWTAWRLRRFACHAEARFRILVPL